MHYLRGKLLQEGLVVSEDIAVLLQVDDPGSGTGWWGRLAVPEEDRVWPGEEYVLALDDDRSGVVFLQSATYHHDHDTQALFQGQGALR